MISKLKQFIKPPYLKERIILVNIQLSLQLYAIRKFIEYFDGFKLLIV